ncbi:DUF5908 family protein [Neiella marina]|uniref:DUF5908 family protein n=1 Tax=Neiella marina TaxID=508461 RepID=UPI00166A9376|nr:DUF5908 family protein [Neiella marina]
MPLLIDEVVISIQVDNHQSGGASGRPTELQNKQQIVAECVEQVMELLQQREEP